ncbi:MAG: hypothetical protein VXW27_10105, partial [Pseudomonadota bacterium]|nr:hypothetical protein [Pseudomonadota bacterium]
MRRRRALERGHLREQLGALAAAREAEQSQLRLALNHEEDKLGAGAKDAPQVAVMRKQERLAASDAAQIETGRSRTTS